MCDSDLGLFTVTLQRGQVETLSKINTYLYRVYNWILIAVHTMRFDDFVYFNYTLKADFNKLYTCFRQAQIVSKNLWQEYKVYW